MSQLPWDWLTYCGSTPARRCTSATWWADWSPRRRCVSCSTTPWPPRSPTRCGDSHILSFAHPMFCAWFSQLHCSRSLFPIGFCRSYLRHALSPLKPTDAAISRESGCVIWCGAPPARACSKEHGRSPDPKDATSWARRWCQAWTLLSMCPCTARGGTPLWSCARRKWRRLRCSSAARWADLRVLSIFILPFLSTAFAFLPVLPRQAFVELRAPDMTPVALHSEGQGRHPDPSKLSRAQHVLAVAKTTGGITFVSRPHAPASYTRTKQVLK